ncbi:hypothetical protein KAR91_34695 [Candidatus Pacearchaeota archaeon]|nr:hypothetical protein [Candidatus Pacearchaeota archaeon]
MTEEDLEEIIDVSTYDFDQLIEYDKDDFEKLSKAANVEKNMSIRSCHNPECRWEEMLTDELRFCPICDWEIKGWKSKTL